jgi:phosphopantetheine adenylyltransferase
MNFLVDELEPRHFRELLIGIDGSEVVVEKVMSTEPRKERCRELLNFIIQKKNTDRFVQELERRNKTHIVEFLMASKQDSGRKSHS